MNSSHCPQCKNEINATNRLFQDECGHRKCRTCVLNEETCKMCQETQNFIINQTPQTNVSNVSVIKYDGNIKEATEPTKQTKPNSSNEDGNDVPTKQKKSKTNDKKVKRQYKSLVIPDHVITVTQSPLLYKCTICSKSFHSTSNVKYHIYCNGKEKPFKCAECDKTFVTNSSLEIHSRSHSGLKPFECNYCNKQFSERGKLNRHLKLHSGNFEFVCSHCGKKFPTNDGLKSHLRLHSGEKPFRCNHCDSSFSNKSNLNKHLALHAKEKLFMCEQCGKKFRGKHALSVHKKRHTTKKPFKCSFCEKGFLSNKELKRHTLIHKDLKIYGCTMCSTKFRRKDNLDRHLRNIHSSSLNGEKPKKSTTQCKSEIKSSPNLDVSKPTVDNEPPTNEKTFKEKPNAINVIKSSNKVEGKNAVPVINGPFKLAFKNGTFKHNYNIHNRDYPDTVKSLDIFHKILPPINSETKNNESQRNVITSVGKVNERDSLEICKKILAPIDTPIHYETSFENKTHASIKNIKFKLPSTYTNNAIKSSEVHRDEHRDEVQSDDFPQNGIKKVNGAYDMDYYESKEYTELRTANFNMFNEDKNEYQSVIVNPQSLESDRGDVVPPFNEMHWRKRTTQFSSTKKS